MARMPRLSLLAKFSITSFGLLLAMGVSLGFALTRHFEEQAIEQQKMVVSSLVLPVVGPFVDESLMKSGANAEKYRTIEQALSFLGNAGLVRIKIWNHQGMIVYSDDPQLVGRNFPVEHDLEEALQGQTVAELTNLGSAENELEQGFGELLEVYTPLQFPGESEVRGVFEGYYDVTELRASIAATTQGLWTSLGAGFAFLYLSLFTIVRTASRKLEQQSAENAQLYRQADARLRDLQIAEAATQRQVKRLGALRQIDVAINSSLDLKLTLTVILDQVCEQLHVDSACILLMAHETQTLYYGAGRGFRTDVAASARLVAGEGHAGRAAQTRRTIHIPQLKAETELERALKNAAEGFVSYVATPLVAKGRVEGVLEIFHRSPLQPEGEWLEFLEMLAGQAAIALDNASLFNSLQRSNVDLALAYDDTLEGWSRALDLRDKETEGHSQRVTALTIELARSVGASEADLVQIRRGALLHDIGKMAIPDAILHKPGRLDADEWAIMKKHPVYAYEMLSPISFLKPALDIPYCHHEKWDGSGYPRGLKGEEIPLAARIFAVVDVWDALRSDRPYRRARPTEMVCAYIKEQAGRHFDPRVAEAFLRMIAEMQPARPAGRALFLETIPVLPSAPDLRVVKIHTDPALTMSGASRNGH
jgi:putative nucleotidyltransferase with HDIG domain